MATVTKPPALDETLQAVNDTLGEIRDALEGGGGGEYIPKVAGATAGNVPTLKADGTLEDSGETIPSKTSDLTNDSNYVSDAAYVHTDNNYTSAEKTSVGQITGIKNDLSELEGEALDIKMLGWSVPKECPIHNYMDANRKFHQRVGRVDLGNLEWRYDSLVTVFVSGNINCKNDGEGIPCYSYIYTQESGSNIVSTDKDKLVCVGSTYLISNAVVVKNLSYTDASAFKSAMQGVYLYYELATEITIPVDGNEAISNPLSGALKFIAGKVNWDGIPEIFTIEQYSIYVVFACTANQRAIYLVNGIGAQAAAVQVAGDNLASFSINGFTVTANINRYCGYAIYRLTKEG